MHVAAVIGQSAGITKYALPVSDRSCRITHRAMLVMAVVFNVRPSVGEWYVARVASRCCGWEGMVLEGRMYFCVGLDWWWCSC